MVFVICLLVLVNNFVIQTFQCDTDVVDCYYSTMKMSRLFNSSSLYGRHLHQTPARSLIECQQMCMNHYSSCTYIAYDKTKGSCDVFTTEGPNDVFPFAKDVFLYERVLNSDCTDAKNQPGAVSGVYLIHQPPTNAFLTYCDMSTDGKAWTVFQRRISGTIDFNQNWEAFALGFGDICGEFWMGNENIYRMTSSDSYELRIDMIDTEGSKQYAVFNQFRIGSESDKYRIHLGKFIRSRSSFDHRDATGFSLTTNKPNSFTTTDRDNDRSQRDINCANTQGGGWWYSQCAYVNLNGDFKSHFYWKTPKPNKDMHLTFSEMKMRRIA
ncbi:fibrinogen-like protein A [Antedon mediterranea]|uniref:fibrinogen-like protein A n=1 Tax=Antedon mediterranea TaxID=105859 RepID=UPI003AF5D6D2